MNIDVREMMLVIRDAARLVDKHYGGNDPAVPFAYALRQTVRVYEHVVDVMTDLEAHDIMKRAAQDDHNDIPF